MKRKGFTLIELLAVIIILGILMLIAIPSVTSYINNSRKSTYITTIDELVKGTITKVNSGDISIYDTETTYYVPCTCVKLENGEAKSPYGKFDPAYIVVTFDGDNYNYYFTGKDVKNMGVPAITKSDLLSKESIVANVQTIDTSIGITGTSKVTVFNDDCTEIDETKLVSNTVSGEEGSSSGGSSSSSSDSSTSVTCTIPKKTCPTSYTPTIYWALTDIVGGRYGQKLIISDSPINDVSGDKGSFAGNTVFENPHLVPWVDVETEYYQYDSKSMWVEEVIIRGNVAPTSTAWWFSYVGEDVESFTANLQDLEMCHVTNMDHMMTKMGAVATDWNIGDLCAWDTSKVTNMSSAFAYAGSKATTWDVGDIGNWNTSKVTKMNSLFFDAGSDSTDYSFPNISKWNTSNVTDMRLMFFNSFRESTKDFSLDLNKWDTSKVTTVEQMFAGAFNNSLNVDINFSKWNTSKFTSIYMMFDNAFTESNSVSINLSNWNMSNVSNMGTEYTFRSVGLNSSSCTIKIPKTNGGGLNNTSSLMYGKDTTYAAQAYPPTGKSFTLAS